ncbi:anhydro-N-acetylmuramic acid kinase [Noviherbaspirillum denitrificans]|uniref:Anhydro-N-acetylmuramic acid kinase n=1 Tax=Noviherbaspirillum denitrificans TaxID=1968433 RepID=A0A254TQC7_9BURK|nr:anhydro-N-acetylmuramic acid kinase [Noviherbaspirillum denitrificans]OWW21938.1 anhydro-N-acetylmuramic acid kinase [Noviherbaspirillum denitrificans]
MPAPQTSLYVGLMSGTSLDGVDGVLAEFSPGGDVRTRASAYLPFPPALRSDLLKLQAPGENEIHIEALSANGLAQVYADCVSQLLEGANVAADAVEAIGAHGQTVRHRPELGYTRQTGNPALLAELTGIDVIADFRSRDIAAGGQGAPLVPAFHQAVFGSDDETRVVVNIGGIGNISVLDHGKRIIGFDTGPGNVLMDGWIAQHHGKTYDAGGAWAASGKEIPALLAAMMADPYLALPPPKSTGRDLFHAGWLERKLAVHPGTAPEDVQATLAAFTAETLAHAIARHAPDATSVHVCGGGAYNSHLMQRLQQSLRQRHHLAKVDSTDVLGVSPNHVEALAFAWLAQRFVTRQAGNLPAVTGASGLRILGALYPA